MNKIKQWIKDIFSEDDGEAVCVAKVLAVIAVLSFIGYGCFGLYKDHFDVAGYVVWFTRDKNGKVNGMHVGASRMRDMPFVRVK